MVIGKIFIICIFSIIEDISTALILLNILFIFIPPLDVSSSEGGPQYVGEVVQSEFLFIEKRVAEIYLDWYFRVVYLMSQTILHNLDIITSWLFPVPTAV